MSIDTSLPRTLNDGSVCSNTMTIYLRDKPLKITRVGFGLDEMTIRSLFVLAHISPLRIWRLPNGYFTFQDGEDERTTYENAIYREYRPAWLIKVPCGLINITTRKNVVDIDWGETPVCFSRETGITTDNVTKGATHVHAWSVEKVLEYLKLLSVELEKHPLIWPNAEIRTD
jgi:hypothetical protein